MSLRLVACMVAVFFPVVPICAAQGVPRPEARRAVPDTVAFVARHNWDPERLMSSRAPLELTLTRPLEPGQRVALLVGSMDVSGGVMVRGERITYVPDVLRLPAGATEVAAYIVETDGTWYEIARAGIRVRTAAGFDGSTRDAAAELNSAGALAEHLPVGAPTGRRAHQDFTLRLGYNGQAMRNGWEVAVQSNAMGVSRKEQRLRWNEQGVGAPRLDLADYRVQVARGGFRAGVGNVAVGANRYLLSGFASRGITAGGQLGRAVSVDAAVVNGTNVVGWENPLGAGTPDHRLWTTGIAVELVPSRPGAARVDLSGLDGAVLPLTGVTQGAVTDAERSRGYGVQLGLADAAQRVRFSGGVSRSRFTNPADPTLGPSDIVPVRSETRSARFGDLTVQVLPERMVFGRLKTALGTTLRHERVDPLYRSIGASVGADMRQDAAEFVGTLGALALQGSAGRGRDNLAGIPSILTTRTGRRGVNVATPVAGLLGVEPRPWLPVATFAWERTTQIGDGVPVNGDFSASHVPAQWSYHRVASLSWTWPRLMATWRWNGSVQDNRQPGRESSDLRANVHALSLGLTGWPAITPSLEASVERQAFAETGLQQRTTRLSGATQATIARNLGITANLSRTWSFDPFASRRVRNVEAQGEISRSFSWRRVGPEGPPGRVFIRYARTRAQFLPLIPDPALMSQLTWTVHAGSSFRLF